MKREVPGQKKTHGTELASSPRSCTSITSPRSSHSSISSSTSPSPRTSPRSSLSSLTSESSRPSVSQSRSSCSFLSRYSFSLSVSRGEEKEEEAPPPSGWESRNVILVGACGQGKSTIANLLLCTENLTEVKKNGVKSIPEFFKRGRRASRSETQRIQSLAFLHTYQNRSYEINVVDTPGLDDPREEKEDVKTALKIAQAIQELKTIAKVVFVYKYGTKGTGSFKKTIEYYAKLLKKSVMNNNAMVIVNNVSETEEQAKMRAEMEETIPRIIENAVDLVAKAAQLDTIPTFFLNGRPSQQEAHIQISNRTLILNAICQSSPIVVPGLTLEKPLFLQSEEAKERRQLEGAIPGFTTGLDSMQNNARPVSAELRRLKSQVEAKRTKLEELRKKLANKDTEKLINMGNHMVEVKSETTATIQSEYPIREVTPSYNEAYIQILDKSLSSDFKQLTLKLKKLNVCESHRGCCYVIVSLATFNKDKEAKEVARLRRDVEERAKTLVEEEKTLVGKQKQYKFLEDEIENRKRELEKMQLRLKELSKARISLQKLEEYVKDL